MARVYLEDEIVCCPHCNAMQDDVAEDFVVPGFEKEKAHHECYDCEGSFTVRQDGDNYYVEPL